MIEILHDAGRIAVSNGLSSLLQSVALALIVGLFDLTLGHRIRVALRHALWMLVIFKLLLPPALELPTGAAYWVGRWALPPRELPAIVVTPLDQPLGNHEPIEVIESLPPSSPPHSYGLATFPDPLSALLLLWLAGSMALAVGIAFRQRQINRLLRNAIVPPAALISALEAACAELGLRRIPRLRLTRENHSPAVCGGLNPTILLPGQLAGIASRSVLRSIFLHELVHIQRRDLALNAVQILVQFVWWWNPVAWIANARVRALREIAVDQRVQQLHGDDNPTAYPAALLEVARHCHAQSMLTLGFVGILGSGRSIHQRIQSLLTQPVPTRSQLGTSGWATILVLALLLLPMGFSRRTALVAAEPVPSSQSNPVIADSLPKDGLRILVLGNNEYLLGTEALDLDRLRAALKKQATLTPDFPLHLQAREDVPFGEVVAAYRIAREVGINRVVIHDATASFMDFDPGPSTTAPPLYTRRYRVNSTVFIQNLQSATGTETEVKPGPGLQALIRTHFHSKGVEFPAPSEISTNASATDRKAFFLNDRTGIFFVRATETELNRIESIIASELSPRSDQMIQFETRIVELPADALDEIGLPPGKITLPSNQIDPARRTVLTPKELRQMLARIESSPHGSLVRSSRITTVEGLNATLLTGAADDPAGTRTEHPITLHLQPKIETGPDPLRLSINLVGQAVALPESSSARTSPNLRPYVLSHFQLPFGHTVAMLAPTDSNSPPALHRRLILITPTLIDPAGNQLAP
jgi:beta-lactamase regulating signal transducer with metallopeptidase domain